MKQFSARIGRISRLKSMGARVGCCELPRPWPVTIRRKPESTSVELSITADLCFNPHPLNSSRAEPDVIPAPSNPLQFVDASVGEPFRNIEVSVCVPARAVGRDKETIHPTIGRNRILTSLLRIGVVAQMSDQPVILVQDRHPAG